MPGTAQHVVHLSTDDGIADLYTHESDFPDRGHVSCWATSRLSADGAGGGGAGCSDLLEPPPQISGGWGGGSDQDARSYEQWLLWAPPGAARFHVELSTGDTLKANVVNRGSVVLWNGDEGEYATRATILDADQNELWVEDFGEPIPGPFDNGAPDPATEVEAVIKDAQD